MIYFYKTKIGKLGIREENEYITNIYFENDPMQNKEIKETPLITKTYREITLYLDGLLKEFSIPILLNGTNFQKSIWQEIYKIKYGKTCSYKDIGEVLNTKAYQAIGGTCGKNPIPIIVPCHRVIGKDGSLTGYRGGIEIKEILLDLEKNT